MHRRNQGRTYCQHPKSRNCPGGLDCCGSLFGCRKTGAKPKTRRYVRRVAKNKLRKVIDSELEE